MRNLLNEFDKIKKKYYGKKKREEFANEREWSIAMNCELAKVLEQMDSKELEILLEKSTGYFRGVVGEYLKKKSKVPRGHDTAAAIDPVAAIR